MTARAYLLRSLLHYRFAYTGVFAGAVLGATVLLGALFAGDSVKASLRRIGELRTGRATHLVTSGDRFFRQALASDLARDTGFRFAPVVYARGTATHATTRAAANRVQLIGITDAFWEFAPTPTTIRLEAARPTAAINEPLARRLGIGAGDTLVVRVHKPGILAGNAPIAGAESALESIRCTVAAVVDDASFGRFSLETTQVAAPSIFLPIETLQAAFEREERANLLLVDAGGAQPDLRDALARTIQLADYGLSLRWLETAGTFELTSDRIFIDPEIANAAKAAAPNAQPVLSYLVNEFRVRERTTPYSIATAATHDAAPFLPADLGPQEIVLNDWLADDLEAQPGDDVRLTFFQAGAAGALIEQDATFRVRAIVPLRGLAADRAWMPDFPGISDVDSPGDWDPGLPLDLERIRDKDERYWDDFRGAPKAFLSIDGGRKIWSTRWGNTTALRIPLARERESELMATLLRALRPEMNQLLVQDFRAAAQASAQSPVDFGGLFVGMSFFLIVAALGLVAMLFQLTLLQRNREDALLGAVGVSARKLQRWRLAESVALLLVATVAGIALGTLYTRAILRFLESIWAGQGGGATFVFAAQPANIAGGSVGFVALSLLTIWLAIRRRTRRALSIRLAAHAEETGEPRKIRRSSLLIALVAAAIAAGAIAVSGRGLPAQAAFYLAGFALLAAGIALCRRRLVPSAAALAVEVTRPSVASVAHDAKQVSLPRPRRADASLPLSASRLGKLNLETRRTRSLTVMGLIATAVFMVLSVASFRKHVGSDWLARDSGTGGFAFLVETTAPLNPVRDGSGTHFEVFEAQAAQLGGIVALRAGTGDNANCFNLNTTAQPQLLAVDAARLAARGAFATKHADWAALRSLDASGAIPALVDETTLLWALKRKVGDALAYTDENGESFEVRIVGTLPDSIFQGYVIVDESRFLEKFPSHAGYSVFLVDAQPTDSGSLAALRQQLEASTRDAGGRVELTRDVLAAFHQIENTYIAIFNVLGSLGVALGSLGLAIVVARNLRERRGEFAVMAAIGIPRSVLARMVLAEFGRLVLWGIAIGLVASAIAVWPNLTSLPAAPTIALVLMLLCGIVVLNLASGWLIFRWSMRDLRPSVVQAAG